MQKELTHLTMAQLYRRRERLLTALGKLTHDAASRQMTEWELRRTTDEIRARGGQPERLPNPAWLDKAVARSWGVLEQKLPPIAVLDKRGDLRARELGCGFYGCVLPTTDAGVVLKVTSDPTEARFVSLLFAHGLQEPGMVRYDGIAPLPGRYHGRALYGIWREAAYEVGDVIKDRFKVTGKPNKEERDLRQFGKLLIDFRDAAKRFYDVFTHIRDPWSVLEEAQSFYAKPARLVVAVDRDAMRVKYPWPIRDAELRIAILLRICELTAGLMTLGAEGREVGQTLFDLLNDGVLLADVHYGNIGRVDRPGRRGLIVITDPGLAMPLRQDWNRVEIKAA